MIGIKQCTEFLEEEMDIAIDVCKFLPSPAEADLPSSGDSCSVQAQAGAQKCPFRAARASLVEQRT